MQKSDEIILLCSVYNKISDKYNTKTSSIEKDFKEAIAKLINKGHISQVTANDVMYCLIPNERAKIIKAYKSEEKEKNNGGYSKDFNENKAKKLIDEVLSDTPNIRSTGFTSTEDPCFSSINRGRSLC